MRIIERHFTLSSVQIRRGCSLDGARLVLGERGIIDVICGCSFREVRALRWFFLMGGIDGGGAKCIVQTVRFSIDIDCFWICTRLSKWRFD